MWIVFWKFPTHGAPQSSRPRAGSRDHGQAWREAAAGKRVLSELDGWQPFETPFHTNEA
jgi:hypothetical protein